MGVPKDGWSSEDGGPLSLLEMCPGGPLLRNWVLRLLTDHRGNVEETDEILGYTPVAPETLIRRDPVSENLVS